MTKTDNPTPSQSKTIQQAVWIGTALAGNTSLFLALSIYQVIATGTWQAWAFFALIAVTEALIILGIPLVRRGRLELGSWIFLVLSLLAPIIVALLFVSLGYVAAAYILIANFFIIRYILPQTYRRLAIALLGISVVLSLLTEVTSPVWRQVSPVILTISPILTTTLGIAFLVVVGYQAWRTSMRNKLLVAFIGVALITAGALAFFTYVTSSNILHQSLEQQLVQHTSGAADQISSLLNEQINVITALSLNDALQQTVKDIDATYAGDATKIQATLAARDAQWQAADAQNNDNDPLVHEYLTNPAALDLKEFQNTFPNNVEIFITDAYGGQAGTTNRTSDYNQADEAWWQAAYNNGKGAVYLSEPEFDESSKTLAVLIAVPIHDRNSNKLIGILRSTFQISALNAILGEKVGDTGETDLFIPGDVISKYHNGLYTQVDTKEFNALQAISGQGMADVNYEGADSVVLSVPVQSLKGSPAVNELKWTVVFHQQQQEASAPLNTQIRGVLIVFAILMVLAIGAAYVLALYLVRPISLLTQTAQEVAAGDLNSRAKVTSADEIGLLASTFNNMTSQLQEILQGLEERIAARTKDLATVAEVGTATATILESRRLLQEVVDLTKERFNLYHSHIYLLDETGENLVLAAGAGEPGRIMVSEGRSIPLSREQSLVARAARERKGVTVNDVTQAPDFLSNPLLPDTHSELAVPMIVGGNVIGVFDIQSEQVGRFTEADVNIQTTLAAQLATSIQNVRSFEQSRKQVELETMVNAIGQKIQRTTSVEDALQTAIRELGTAIGASRVKVSIAGSASAPKTITD